MLHRKPILTITFLIVVCMGLFVTSNYRLFQDINHTLLTDNARNTLLAVAEAQRLYSDSTADPIMKHHPEIHLSLNPNSIPNPATFAIRFGERLTKHNFTGMKVRVYSDYPFKHRLDTGGIQDDFEQRALQYLRTHSQAKGEETEFLSVEPYQAQTTLRMATPIIMKRSCITCHNTHPNSMKRDWKIGDVRGVRSVIIPTNSYEAKAQNTIITSSLIILFAMFVLLLVIWFIIKALQSSIQKERHLLEATEALNATLVSQNQAINRFVPDQIHSILGKQSIVELNLGDAKKLNGSILFSDIRSFTRISEQLQDTELFRLLNAYMGYMEQSIRKHNGFIDKYIGDAIMAIFLHSPDDAVRAALSMRAALHEFNKEFLSDHSFKFNNGIGIHTGDCILGTIGVQERMSGTAIGDTVNISAHVESLTKTLKTPIIITEITLQALEHPESFITKSIGEVQLKNKLQAIHIYAVEELNATPSTVHTP